MASETLRDAIRERIVPIATKHRVDFSFTPLFPGAEAFANDQGELVATCARLTGHEPQSVAFATEAPFLQALGMDTVVLGPGSIDVAHQPDEYMALDQVQPCIELLRALVQRYCLDS